MSDAQSDLVSPLYGFPAALGHNIRILRVDQQNLLHLIHLLI